MADIDRTQNQDIPATMKTRYKDVNGDGSIHAEVVAATQMIGTTPISDADPLPADLMAGENHIGQVGGASIVADSAIAMTTAGAYAIGDFVGTSATALEFTVARINAGSGVITGAVLVDKALQSLAGELWLFDASVTPPNDNAAWTISDADAIKCLGVIPFNTYYANAQNSVSIVTGLSITFACAAASKKIYGAFVTRGAPSYLSNDLYIRLRVLQD